MEIIENIDKILNRVGIILCPITVLVCSIVNIAKEQYEFKYWFPVIGALLCTIMFFGFLVKEYVDEKEKIDFAKLGGIK